MIPVFLDTNRENFFKHQDVLFFDDLIGPYHSAAMLSLGGIKSFVFARQASARHEFSARLAVQKQSFYSPETQHGHPVIRVYFIYSRDLYV